MALTVISIILQLIVLPIGIYYVAVGFAGFLPERRSAKAAANEKYTRFAVIVPAHNEEGVIGKLVQSLKKQDYPDTEYEIFVIADNCTDGTADAARKAGASVLERTDAQRRGKGYAMEWFFERLYKMEREFD